MTLRRVAVKLASFCILDKQKRDSFYTRYCFSDLERYIFRLERKVDHITDIAHVTTDMHALPRARGLLRRVQLIELEVYKEIDRVCKKHSIDFWAICGTLLGAVRHAGFIPWDDDIDLAMMDDAFVKFRDTAAKDIDPKICKVFALPGQIIRVCHADFSPQDCDVESWMALTLKGRIAPAVDIYPFYETSRAGSVKDVCEYNEMKKERMPYMRRAFEHGEHAALVKFVNSANERFMDRGGAFCFMGQEEASYPNLNMFYRKDAIFPVKRMPFENAEILVPRLAEYYLTKWIGDYECVPKDMHKHVDCKSIDSDELDQLYYHQLFV